MLHNLRRAAALLFGLLLVGLPLCAEGFQPLRTRHAMGASDARNGGSAVGW